MTYSANDNQNFFVSEGRTTSRVLAQPGGQSSISLGGWTPEELERARKLRAEKNKKAADTTVETVEEVKTAAVETITTEDNATIHAAPGKENGAEAKTNQQVLPVQDKPAPASKAISSNAFASAASTNSFNVITDRPTSRVTRPPGGHCSIVLG